MTDRKLTAPSDSQGFEKALCRLGNDHELLCELAVILLDDAPPLLLGIQQDIERENLAAAAKHAHALKGLVVTFDDAGCGLQMHELLNALRNEDKPEVARLFPKCEANVRKLTDRCAKLLR